MVSDCWVFVDMGRFYLQSNTARIMPSTLPLNGMSRYSGATIYPKGTDNYWTYDFEGSFKIQKDGGSIGNQSGAPREAAKTGIPKADVKNPIDIARLAEAKRFRPRSRILGAEFLN
jgi:hypothetical protein